MNKIKIYITWAILSTVVLYFEINSIFSIGKIINKYFPCKQNLADSFPCFGIYDIYFILWLITILLITITIIGFKFYKTIKNTKSL